ncbi:MAG: GUN4 domain-containing protein, partial [Cyanobacteriota bacterium]|nr:GUN4 domain-containing protein [Cyanobacteriota bacterium]
LRSASSEPVEFDLETVRLDWARQKWQEIKAFKQTLKDASLADHSSLNLSEKIELSQRLDRIETQLQAATVDRENLQNQLGWVLHYLELLNPEKTVQILSRLETEFDESRGEETPFPSEVGMDYLPLSELLAAGDWKNADEYTWQILLYLARREPETWLRPEDLDNFPCTDLNTIDYLWNYYSHGLFGFTVQQQILENVAGDYASFCDKIGWRTGENWKYYDELIFNLNAPLGHLPVMVWRKRACYGIGSGTAAENLALLFNRLSECQNS